MQIPQSALGSLPPTVIASSVGESVAGASAANAGRPSQVDVQAISAADVPSGSALYAVKHLRRINDIHDPNLIRMLRTYCPEAWSAYENNAIIAYQIGESSFTKELGVVDNPCANFLCYEHVFFGKDYYENPNKNHRYLKIDQRQLPRHIDGIIKHLISEGILSESHENDVTEYDKIAVYRKRNAEIGHVSIETEANLHRHKMGQYGMFISPPRFLKEYYDDITYYKLSIPLHDAKYVKVMNNYLNGLEDVEPNAPRKNDAYSPWN